MKQDNKLLTIFIITLMAVIALLFMIDTSNANTRAVFTCTDATTGYIQNRGGDGAGNYVSMRDSTNGLTAVNTEGHVWTAWLGDTYEYVNTRQAITLETLDLTANAVLDSAYFHVRSYAAKDSSVYTWLVNGTFTGAIATSWFNDFTGWAASGIYSLTSLSDDSLNFASADSFKLKLNAAGLAAISKTGNTTFMMLTNMDRVGTPPPTSMDYVGADLYDDFFYLEVWYTLVYHETFYMSATGDGTAPEVNNPATAWAFINIDSLARWNDGSADDGKIGAGDTLVILPDLGKIRGQLTVRQSGVVDAPIVIRGTGGSVITGLDTLAVALFDSSFANFGADVWAMAVVIDTTATGSSMLYHTHKDSTTNFYSTRKPPHSVLTGNFWFSFTGDSVYVKMPSGDIPANYLWEYDVRQYGIYSSGNSYVTIDSLEIAGFRKSLTIDSYGIYARYGTNITVSNCNINDIYYRTNPNYPLSTSWEQKRGIGIWFYNNNLFDAHGNIVKDMASAAITASNDNSSYTITGGSIYDNDITNFNVGIAIGFAASGSASGLSGIKIYNNYVHDFDQYILCTNWHRDGIHFVGTHLTAWLENIEIYNNYFEDNNGSTGGTAWIYVEYACRGFEIHHNIIAPYGSIYSLWFKGNLAGKDPFAGNHEIYNNTFYQNNIYTSAVSDFDIRNNIFNGGGKVVYASTFCTTNLVSDYNIYYNNGIDYDIVNAVGGAGSCTLSEWQVAGYDSNSLNIDPQFIGNFGTDDDDDVFKLNASSPAINVGIDVGLTTDYDGNAVDGVFDIGAYEYQSATPSPITIHTYTGTSAVDAQDTLDNAMDNYDILILENDLSGGSLTFTNIGQKIKGSSPTVISGKEAIISWTDSIGGTTNVTDTLNAIIDGYVSTYNLTFAVARDSTSGNGAVTTSIRFGVDNGSMQQIFKSFMSFEIPSFTTLVSAILHLNGTSNNSTTDLKYVLTQATYQPTVDKLDWRAILNFNVGATHTGTILADTTQTYASSANFTTADNPVTLNAGALTYLTTVKSDTARIAFLSNWEWFNIAPANDSYVIFAAGADSGATLEIQYTVGGAAHIAFKVLSAEQQAMSKIWFDDVRKTSQVVLSDVDARGECYDGGDTLYVYFENPDSLTAYANRGAWEIDGYGIGINDGTALAHFDSCSVENLVFIHFNDTGFQFRGDYGHVYNVIGDSLKLGGRVYGTGNIIKNVAIITADSSFFNGGASSNFDYNAYSTLPDSDGVGTNDMTDAITGVNGTTYVLAANSNLINAGINIGYGNDIGADQFASALAITTPAGDENYVTNQVVNISWTHYGVDSLKILLSTDGGVSYPVTITVSETAGDDSLFAWTVPDSISTECKIKIEDLFDNPVTSDESEEFNMNYELAINQRFYLMKDGVPTPLMKDGRVTPLKEP